MFLQRSRGALLIYVMPFSAQNITCALSFLSQFEEWLLPKLQRTVIQLHLLQHFIASVLDMNKVITESYAKEFHGVLLNVLSVQSKFKVAISCANWLIKLTAHANSCLDKIKLAI